MYGYFFHIIKLRRSNYEKSLKKHTVEEKLQCVKMYLNNHKSSKEIQKETGIYDRLIRSWISIYITEGIEGLKNKIEYNKTQFKELFYKNIFSGYISHFFQYMKNLKSKIML